MGKEIEMNHAYRSMTGLQMYIPGRSEEARREILRQKNWAKEQAKMPMSIVVEIIYMFILFLCSILAVIYLVIALTLIGWKPSVQSITDTGRNGDPVTDYDMMEGIHSKIYATYYLFDSAVLLVFSLAPIYYAAFLGNPKWYYFVIITHGFLLIGEVVMYVLSSQTSPDACNSSKFRKSLTELFKWYGILSPHPNNMGHEAMDKINDLQAYMGCCGIDGWEDYLSILYHENWFPSSIGYLQGSLGLLDGFDYMSDPELIGPDGKVKIDREYYLETGRDIRAIPSSCCTGTWAHNIYCADEVLAINEYHPELELPKHRLAQEGCVTVVSRFCTNLVRLFTSDILLLVVAHAVFFVILCGLTIVIFRGFHKLYLRAEEAHRIEGLEESHQEHDSESSYPLLSHTLIKDSKALEPGGGDTDIKQRLEEQSEETLYFGPTFDSNLTEQELYESLRSKLKKRSQKLILDEIHKRRRVSKQSTSLRKLYMKDVVIESMNKIQKSSTKPTPCIPPQSSVGLITTVGQQTVGSTEEVALSHLDKELVKVHRERKRKESQEERN